uniref:PQL-like protein n=1 Tax=Apostasia odorata TaxID=280455 RepID=A0A0F7GXV0_9ASPA|nr:psbQ-like protein 3 [Apostasia odorata]
MAVELQQANPSPPLPLVFTCTQRIRFCQKLQVYFTRRTAATLALSSSSIIAKEGFSSTSSSAFSFDFSFTVPDQTIEEAESGIKKHAQQLLNIREFIDSQSWRAAQTALRESSSRLKQDLYIIIQAKPGGQRPLLRKLYSNLFNNVTQLDYAARSKDAVAVKECYDNIVSTLNEIFAKI